jgi:gamma-glutamyltranspeptidase/glutathione hydrolase
MMLFMKHLFFIFLSTTLFIQLSFAQGLSFNDDMSVHKPTFGHKAMVVSADKYASEVGVQILKQGGNAADAAAAVGFALAVTVPRAGNLGGGGFALFYDAPAKQIKALDYREVAPSRSTEKMYQHRDGSVDSNKSLHSLMGTGVPGTVAGLLDLQEKYGRLTRADILAPAIKLAEEGFPVSQSLALSLWDHKDRLKKRPETARTFFKYDGRPYTPGEIFIQSDLAESLKLISTYGKNAFYTGPIANAIANDMKTYGGIITEKDLENYKPVYRDPIVGRYKGYQIAAMPPPSSGGVHIIQMLNTLENFDLKAKGHNSAASIHIMAEAMKRAYADRSKYLGDPDFVRIPLDKLTAKIYGRRIAESISQNSATPSRNISPGALFSVPEESPQTTHFSVIDEDGSIVSNTYTLNLSYGNAHVITGTGILMNNEMDDFSSRAGVPNAYGLIGGKANKIEAGKRPLSSMTPVIVFKNGEAVLATGSPGGARIITTVLNILVNVLEHEMNIADATAAPRVHHQWMPDELRIEQGISPDTQTLLKGLGYSVSLKAPFGAAMTLAKSSLGVYGYADSRRGDAYAAGY